MTRVTQHLAQLILRDLTQFSGLTFANPDRLTRAEVEQARSWAKTQPAVMKALRDRSDAEFASVRLFKDVLDHFAEAHPQEASGDPTPWKDGRLLADDVSIADLSPDEAAARLAWANTRQEYRTGFLDKSSPDHSALVRQTLALRERANQAEPPAVPASGSPSRPSAEALARIQEARNDPAFTDRSHPSHKAAQEAVQAAYASAYPEPGATPPTATESRDTELQGQIRALREHPATMDRHHPEHASNVEAMSQLYEARYSSEQNAGDQT